MSCVDLEIRQNDRVDSLSSKAHSSSILLCHPSIFTHAYFAHGIICKFFCNPDAKKSHGLEILIRHPYMQ